MSNSTTNPSQETCLSPEPLTTCPKCTYALTGLPSAHRCPECGFEYDEYSWSWRMPEKKWRRLRKTGWAWMFYPTLIFVPELLRHWRSMLTSGLTVGQSLWLAAHLILVATWIRWLFFIDELPILVVTKEGITFRGKASMDIRTKFVRRISWHHLSDVGQGAGLHKGAYWLLRDNGRQIEMRHYISNKDEWEVLKKALLDAKAHYLTLKQASKP